MAKRKNPAAVALSRLGAKKGGDARGANMTPHNELRAHVKPFKHDGLSRE
jgi:hypothetical protein